jgi:hypothetical protein
VIFWGVASLMTISRRMVYPFLKRSLEVREGLGRASKSQGFADVVTVCLAQLAFETWEADL